jgi:hypothetical protein
VQRERPQDRLANRFELAALAKARSQMVEYGAKGFAGHGSVLARQGGIHSST